jgi:hypothetical protein
MSRYAKQAVVQNSGFEDFETGVDSLLASLQVRISVAIAEVLEPLKAAVDRSDVLHAIDVQINVVRVGGE